MDHEDFEDHMVEKAKELLAEQSDIEDTLDRPDRPSAGRDVDGPGDRGPDSIDRPSGFNQDELDTLQRNRAAMDNDALRSFLEQDTDFHEDLEQAGDTAFSRWEERIMVQSHTDRSIEEIANELDRDPAAVRVHMHKLGLKTPGTDSETDIDTSIPQQ